MIEIEPKVGEIEAKADDESMIFEQKLRKSLRKLNKSSWKVDGILAKSLRKSKQKVNANHVKV